MDARTLCRALAMHALVVERAVNPDRNGTVLEAEADRLAERIEGFATQAPISASEREARAAAIWGATLPSDGPRPVAGRPMERGDLFAGIGGWARAGCGECETNCIVWLTTDEASRYVDCGLGSYVHRLDEAT